MKKEKENKPIKKKKAWWLPIMGLAMLAVLSLGGILIVGTLLAKEREDSRYPSGVLIQGDLSAFSRSMESIHYKPLREIAVAVAKDGAGPLLTPVDSKEFDYEGQILSKLSVNGCVGHLIVRQGSGDIQKDIADSTPYYYDFLGRLRPSYGESVSEKGQLDRFDTVYSAGFVSPGNFIRKGGFYVMALECTVSSNGRYLFVAYASEDQDELAQNIGMMKEFTALALQGEEADQSDGTLYESGEAGTSGDAVDMDGDEELSLEQYLKDHGVDEDEQVPVSRVVSQNNLDGGEGGTSLSPDEEGKGITIDLEEETP